MSYSPLSNSRQKQSVLSQSVDVARKVRPPIGHAQDVISGGLGQEWEYETMLSFCGGPVCVQPFVLFLLLVFSFFLSWLCPFLKNQIVFFWVCRSTFWCFVLLCSVLKVFFKRTIYPVLIWCYSSLDTVYFFLSHAVRLCFVVLSKLALVSLDFIKFLSNRVKDN